MQAIHDIIGSVVIGGIIVMMMLSFNSSVMEGSVNQTFNSIVQSNVTSLTEMIEYDFRKMGYRVGTIHDSAIVYADSVRILMKGDLDNDHVVENVAYFLDVAGRSGHVNPRSRILYRQVNGGAAQKINLGVTRFHLAYYDFNDKLITENPVKAPSAIKALRIAVTVESTSPIDESYAGGTWERTITPKNLRLGLQP
jgi:hypothetical protein